jgi:hypothetical protein
MIDAMLLNDVKEHLRITWDEEDQRITKIIKRGQAYLQDICGTSLSFDKEDQIKQLLLERCRYEYNNALEDFETNYKSEIMRLIVKKAIEARSTNGTP